MVPHPLQNFAPSGFSVPQEGQVAIVEAYVPAEDLASAVPGGVTIGSNALTVVGLSMGAFCTLDLELRHPERKRSLVVAGGEPSGAPAPYGTRPTTVPGAPDPSTFRGLPRTIHAPVAGSASTFVRFSIVTRCRRSVSHVGMKYPSEEGSGPNVSVPSAPR